MSGTNVEPEKLRPELHQRIDQMSASQLELVHRILLTLELEQVTEDLHGSFDSARAQGKLDRVGELIKEARKNHPYR